MGLQKFHTCPKVTNMESIIIIYNLNKEHFTFHLHCQHSGTFANYN